MRVLVTGGRSYGSLTRFPPGSLGYSQAFAERGIMCRALDRAKAEGMTVMIHGGAHGADAYCSRWARDHEVKTDNFPADWVRDGPSAGPIRNARMISEGRPDLVLAFPGGRGTRDMVRKARAAGIEVREIRARDGGPDG